MAGMDSSPGSIGGDVDEHGDDKKRQPGVKRACNECRQQKVSHTANNVATLRLRGLTRYVLNSFDAMLYRHLSRAARGVTA
jgi:hypothetical protein